MRTHHDMCETKILANKLLCARRIDGKVLWEGRTYDFVGRSGGCIGWLGTLAYRPVNAR
jgi:hypothetical protein